MSEREKTIEEKIIEKDIKAEELAREIFCKYSKDELSCEDCTFPIIQCIPRIWARKIINADYRKAAEVIKETAKKILDNVTRLMQEMLSDEISPLQAFEVLIDVIRQDFGVEVEE